MVGPARVNESRAADSRVAASACLPACPPGSAGRMFRTGHREAARAKD